MASSPLLSIRNLSVAFGETQVVRGVDLDIHSGQCLGLVGESGSGKSVTAFSILGLLPQDARVLGQIRFDEVDLLSLSPARLSSLRGGRIAMVFQEPATSLHPMMTIGRQVDEAIRLHRRLGRRERLKTIDRLFHEVRLPEPAELRRRYPHELSGGMKQRVMIAMALAGEPQLLIADEPTTALDVTVQADILRLLDQIRSDRGLTILLITHDFGIVAEMADQVAVMRNGEIVERGDVEALFAKPTHPYTAHLLASVPSL